MKEKKSMAKRNKKEDKVQKVQFEVCESEDSNMESENFEGPYIEPVLDLEKQAKKDIESAQHKWPEESLFYNLFDPETQEKLRDILSMGRNQELSKLIDNNLDSTATLIIQRLGLSRLEIFDLLLHGKKAIDDNICHRARDEFQVMNNVMLNARLEGKVFEDLNQNEKNAMLALNHMYEIAEKQLSQRLCKQYKKSIHEVVRGVAEGKLSSKYIDANLVTNLEQVQNNSFLSISLVDQDKGPCLIRHERNMQFNSYVYRNQTALLRDLSYEDSLSLTRLMRHSGRTVGEAKAILASKNTIETQPSISPELTTTMIVAPAPPQFVFGGPSGLKNTSKGWTIPHSQPTLGNALEKYSSSSADALLGSTSLAPSTKRQKLSVEPASSQKLLTYEITTSNSNPPPTSSPPTACISLSLLNLNPHNSNIENSISQKELSGSKLLSKTELLQYSFLHAMPKEEPSRDSRIISNPGIGLLASIVLVGLGLTAALWKRKSSKWSKEKSDKK